MTCPGSTMRASGWKYYLPENGDEAVDAEEIHLHPWEQIAYAEDAGRYAAEREWDDRDGWEAGVGATPMLVIVSPDGTETRWRIRREVSVDHYVDEVSEA